MEIYRHRCCAWKTVGCPRLVPNLVGRPSFFSLFRFCVDGAEVSQCISENLDGYATVPTRYSTELSGGTTSAWWSLSIRPQRHPLPEIRERVPFGGFGWNDATQLELGKPQTKIFSFVNVFGKCRLKKAKNIWRECGLQFVHFICLISIFKFDIFKFCHSSLKERLWNGVDWMLPLSHRLCEIMQTKWLDLDVNEVGAGQNSVERSERADWLGQNCISYFRFYCRNQFNCASKLVSSLVAAKENGKIKKA